MSPGSKKESWLGILLTAVLCGGFLYWWFRPQPPAWQHESSAQLVARAAAEPAPSDAAQRIVLDLDFMEVAITQARTGLIDDAQASVGHIAEPAILTEAVRTVAHAFLNSGPSDLGRALRVADMLKDESARASVRSGVVDSLAMQGFPDAAIPEAKTPLQKAALARLLASTDAQAKARELIAAAESALASLPPADAAAVRVELAGAYVNLTLTDGPQKAIDAIKALPPDQQPALWDDLSGWCAGRDDAETALRSVTAAIADPAVRLEVEIDSLLTGQKLRPAAEMEAEVRATLGPSTTPVARHSALISIARIQRNSGLPDPVNAEVAAAVTLREANTIAATIADPAARAAAFLEITRRFADLNLFPEAITAITAATAAARAIPDPAARVPVLLDMADEWLNQAREKDRAALIAEAVALTESGPAAAAPLRAAAVALIDQGDWPRAAALLQRITDPAARHAALTAAATAAAESCLSADPSEPPPRGQPVDGIRDAAAGNEHKAAALVEATEPGYAKARAWLAMAKGQNTPPASLNDYIANSGQPPQDGTEANEPAAQEPPPATPPPN